MRHQLLARALPEGHPPVMGPHHGKRAQGMDPHHGKRAHGMDPHHGSQAPKNPFHEDGAGNDKAAGHDHQSMHAMPAPVQSFHDAFAAAWHLESDDERKKAACAEIATWKQLAAPVKAHKLEGATAAAYASAAEDLGKKLNVVGFACNRKKGDVQGALGSFISLQTQYLFDERLALVIGLETAHQFRDAQIVGADALEGRQEPVQDVESAAKISGAVDGDHVTWRGDHTYQPGLAACVGAGRAGIGLGEIEAHRAQADFLDHLEKGLGKLASLLLRSPHQVEGKARCRFFPNTRQAAQALHEALNRIGPPARSAGP